MRFLIFGCNGMAGHTIALYLKERGHFVTGFDTKESIIVDSIVGNAFDTASVKQIINEGNYDTIVNCIGILNKAAEDNKALSTFLNSYWPHFLVECTKNTNTQVIHMSTDCVFSGKKGSYTEFDYPDGETFYDRTKALGEINTGKDITLRNSIIGPDMNPAGIGLLNWFLQQKESIKGYTKALWTGQTTLQLAKTIEYVALNRCHGLINAVLSTSISKYELLLLFAKYFRKKIKIVPIDGIIADKSLKRTNFDVNVIIPDYETMIKELSDWVKEHKYLYEHYELSD